MEVVSETDQDSVVQELNYMSKPSTLQSLCIKIIKMHKNYSNKVIKISSDEITEEKKVNRLSNNSGADRFSRNLYFSPATVNFDSENLNLLDIDAEEWMNKNEFDSIIHKLTADFPNLENDIGHISRTQIDHTETKSKTLQEEFIDYACCNYANKYFKNNKKAETGDNDLIIISSSDDSDFELSLPNDIDTVSFSSIEYNMNNIQNDEKSKVTLEISPHMQYITKFNETTDTKDTKQELGAISLSSSYIPSKTDEDYVTISDDSLSVNQDLNDSFCSGYNSSDFEFITEEDAKTDSLIINYKDTKELLKNKTYLTVEVSAYNANSSSQLSSNSNIDYRTNHKVPEGENYFDLFSGRYTPTTPWMIENKSLGSLMSTEYAGLGFDIGALSRQIREYQPDDEYKEEAEECAKKILNMYPQENRKRRRRF